jgi:hypothetical protein
LFFYSRHLGGKVTKNKSPLHSLLGVMTKPTNDKAVFKDIIQTALSVLD